MSEKYPMERARTPKVRNVLRPRYDPKNNIASFKRTVETMNYEDAIHLDGVGRDEDDREPMRKGFGMKRKNPFAVRLWR